MNKIFTDQLHRIVEINFPPQKIISLVPSQTELLCNLGLDENIIGVTKFCVHPTEICKSKIKIGGTKRVNIELIKKLQPDLIIANKEENEKDQIQELEKLFPVWVSDVQTIDDALHMIASVGSITGKSIEASNIIHEISEHRKQWHIENDKQINACYLIWEKPYITIGGDTFIHSMMTIAGFNNIFSNEKRYPQITIEQLEQKHPDIILLSSEPYPFTQKHALVIKKLIPNTTCILVDGEMFSWYGSRIKHSFDYFNKLKSQLHLNII